VGAAQRALTSSLEIFPRRIFRAQKILVGVFFGFRNFRVVQWKDTPLKLFAQVPNDMRAFNV
jgi:hypothetical protein